MKSIKLVKKEMTDNTGKTIPTFWLGDEEVCVTCYGEKFPHIHVAVDTSGTSDLVKVAG